MAQKFRVSQLWIKSSAANTSGLKFENLNSSSPTGTGAALGVDASGNVIVIPAGGGGSNIYTTDGTIGAALRTVEFETNQMLWRAYDNVGFSAGKHFPLTFEGATDTAVGIAFTEYGNGAASDGTIPNYGMVGYAGAGSLSGLPAIVEGFGIFAGTRASFHSELEVRLNSAIGEYYMHTDPTQNNLGTEILVRVGQRIQRRALSSITAADISFSNTTASLPGSPTTVQGAIDALDAVVDGLSGGSSGSLVYGMYIGAGAPNNHVVKRGYGGTSSVTIDTGIRDVILFGSNDIRYSGLNIDEYDVTIGATSSSVSAPSFFQKTHAIPNVDVNKVYILGTDASANRAVGVYNIATNTWSGILSFSDNDGVGSFTVSPSGDRALFYRTNGINRWTLVYLDMTTATPSIIWQFTDTTALAFITRFGYSINGIDHLMLVDNDTFMSSNSNFGTGNVSRHDITGAGTWTTTVVGSGTSINMDSQFIYNGYNFSRATTPSTTMRAVQFSAAIAAVSYAYIKTYVGGASSQETLGYYNGNVYFGRNQVSYTLPVMTGTAVTKIAGTGSDFLRIPF